MNFVIFKKWLKQLKRLLLVLRFKVIEAQIENYLALVQRMIYGNSFICYNR